MDLKFQDFKALRRLMQSTLEIKKWHRERIERQLEQRPYIGEWIIWALCFMYLAGIMIVWGMSS